MMRPRNRFFEIVVEWNASLPVPVGIGPLNDVQLTALSLHGFSLKTTDGGSQYRLKRGEEVIAAYFPADGDWAFLGWYESERGWTTGSRDTTDTDRMIELVLGGE